MRYPKKSNCISSNQNSITIGRSPAKWPQYSAEIMKVMYVFYVWNAQLTLLLAHHLNNAIVRKIVSVNIQTDNNEKMMRAREQKRAGERQRAEKGQASNENINTMQAK